MNRWIRVQSVSLIAVGIVAGLAIDRGWHSQAVPGVSVSAQGRNPLPTMESLPAEVAQLKLLVPSNSHIMMDVQFHWTSMYFAAQKRNWPLAKYWFNETRGHIIWLTRKSPTIRNPDDGKDVDIKSIFDAVDTSALAAVKTAIEKKNIVEFNATYKTMLESCYACHKSVGRPYLKPMIPTTRVESIVNLDPNAIWPQ